MVEVVYAIVNEDRGVHIYIVDHFQNVPMLPLTFLELDLKFILNLVYKIVSSSKGVNRNWRKSCLTLLMFDHGLDEAKPSYVVWLYGVLLSGEALGHTPEPLV